MKLVEFQGCDNPFKNFENHLINEKGPISYHLGTMAKKT